MWSLIGPGFTKCHDLSRTSGVMEGTVILGNILSLVELECFPASQEKENLKKIRPTAFENICLIEKR